MAAVAADLLGEPPEPRRTRRTRRGVVRREPAFRSQGEVRSAPLAAAG